MARLASGSFRACWQKPSVGFGAHVGREIDQRGENLRAIGIALEDPHGDTKLRALERQAVGKEMAARTHQEFVAQTPDGFGGPLQAGPEGAPDTVVTDSARFVLVPASRDAHPG